jgi:hypothetical protein
VLLRDRREIGSEDMFEECTHTRVVLVLPTYQYHIVGVLVSRHDSLSSSLGRDFDNGGELQAMPGQLVIQKAATVAQISHL